MDRNANTVDKKCNFKYTTKTDLIFTKHEKYKHRKFKITNNEL